MAITTTSTDYIQTSSIEPLAAVTLLVLAPFVLSSVSSTQSDEVLISTSSISSIAALVNAFNILLSTTHFISASSSPTDTGSISTVEPITNLASLVDYLLAITLTSTNLRKKLSHLAETYIDEAKYSN